MLRRIILDDHGGALLWVIFSVTALVVLGVTTHYLANTELTDTSKKYETTKAFYLAEAGLQRAFSELSSGMDDGWDDELKGSDGDMGTEDDGTLSFGPKVDCFANTDNAIQSGVDVEVPVSNYYVGHYDVRIEDGRHTNKQVGVCTKVRVKSKGVSTQNLEKTVEAVLEIFELPWPPAVVFLVPGDNAAFPDPDFNGQSWMIDGNDTNPDGTPGTQPPIIGIASNASVVPVVGALKDNQRDQVQGGGYDDTTDPPTPSIEQVDLQVNLVETVDYLKEVADNTLSPGTYSNFTGFGSSDDYQVTVVDGDLHLSGPIEGYGVLVVTGNLTVSGQGTWNGFIICLESATFVGGGEAFHLYGTLMVGTSSGEKHAGNFTISGQADLYYSSQILEQATRDVKSTYISSWSGY